jgi:hypothetical protein
MGRGEKMWRVKFQTRKLESLMKKKLGMVFMFELKQRIYNERLQARRDHNTELMFNKYENELMRYVFKGFMENHERNAKMKRILTFVINRNTELQAHAAYILLKSIYIRSKDQKQYDTLQSDTQKLKVTNESISVTEAQI